MPTTDRTEFSLPTGEAPEESKHEKRHRLGAAFRVACFTGGHSEAAAAEFAECPQSPNPCKIAGGRVENKRGSNRFRNNGKPSDDVRSFRLTGKQVQNGLHGNLRQKFSHSV
jgi:hypothetical protein